ncbi:MAG TPA: CNNM domain-containing protein, partial [Chitinophagaceae bacterium]|nr:CNNM domain-containing protein [Chitinophagaceae bacterium]
MDHLFANSILPHSLLHIILAANTQVMVMLAVAIIALLIFSFFITGSEIAFFSLTYKDINMLKTKQDTGWKRIANLMEEPRLLQASLRIANILVNIAIIVLFNLLIDTSVPFPATGWWPIFELFAKVVVIGGTIVLFGEVLPRIRAVHNNLRTAYESSFLVEILYYLFNRIAAWFIRLSDNVERFFGGEGAQGLTQQQLEEAIKSTVHEEDEQRILAGIYNFGNITVKQIMRTRLDVTGIEYECPFPDLKKKIAELHYSRLPVYKNSLDNIVGMIHTKDVLAALNEADVFDWHTLMRQPYFVHEQKFIEDLLTEFQTRRIHFAVVVDEFGGTSGIVTMEDILEEIVGEIKDEFDEEESGNRKLDDQSYIFDGRTMIHTACSMMNLSADTFDSIRGESDSMAGLMLEIAG